MRFSSEHKKNRNFINNQDLMSYQFNNQIFYQIITCNKNG